METNQENRLISEKVTSSNNQLMEKCNEFKIPLCKGYIDYDNHLTPSNMKQCLRH